MKTPMQELLEWVRATLPMDLDTPQMIEQKIESMLEKEKEVIITTAADQMHLTEEEALESAEQYYNETFNTKE